MGELQRRNLHILTLIHYRNGKERERNVPLLMYCIEKCKDRTSEAIKDLQNGKLAKLCEGGHKIKEINSKSFLKGCKRFGKLDVLRVSIDEMETRIL